MVERTQKKGVDGAGEKEDLKKLEAILFVSARFLDMKELVSLSDLNPSKIRELIEKLKKRYGASDSVIQIVQRQGDGREMWKMDVRPEYHYIVNKLAGGKSEFSKAEQETLGIIAFKQPIKQSVVVKIRGNKAYEHIKRLVDLGLVKKKKLGHTNELSLSEDFYNYFTFQENVNSKEIQESLKEKTTEV